MVENYLILARTARGFFVAMQKGVVMGLRRRTAGRKLR